MKKLFFVIFLLSLMLLGFSAQARVLSPELKSNLQDNTTQFNASAGFGDNNILGVVHFVITGLLGLLAIIFLAYTIYAGFKWMTAAGDADDIKKAQATLRTSIIGLIIVLGSYGITYLVFSNMPFEGVAPSSQDAPAGPVTSG
ncbi:MAG: hypothetical protein NT165_02250 [Candidatus Falkowbacteria bacterium]|nr:hypothetical protein [Candidatus Falkowbacteria bacterium]